MMDSRLVEIMALHEKMVQQRTYYEPVWQEIAERIMPDAAIFNQTTGGRGLSNVTPGEKRTQKMFDATAALALQTYGSAMESMLTPRTQRWHGLAHEDESINEDREVQEYYQKVTGILFTERYRPQANFSSQAHECYMSNGAFGTGPMYIDDMLGVGTRYRACHLAEVYLAENFAGIIDMSHRAFKYSARQAYQRFGDELPGKIIKCAMGKDALQEFSFIHCVRPNEDYRANGKKGFKFESYYVSVEEMKIVRATKGYRAFPYAYTRGLTLPGEVYARGPASLVLPDVKQLNEMEKTNLRMGQLSAEPPVLLSADGSLSGFKMQNGALNWGGLDENGNELAKPFKIGSNLNLTLEMMNQKREVINRAFLVTVFQILVDNPQMTATEVLERAREKSELLGPTMGRQQAEFLGPIIARELDILEASGKLPPLPKKLQENGNLWKLEYTSPFNRAQMAEEGIAIQRTIEAAAPIIALDPEAQSVFKGKGADMIRRLAKINGAPVTMLNDDDATQENTAEADQMAMAANVLQAAPLAGKAAKDFAEAQALAAASGASTQANIAMP